MRAAVQLSRFNRSFFERRQSHSLAFSMTRASATAETPRAQRALRRHTLASDMESARLSDSPQKRRAPAADCVAEKQAARLPEDVLAQVSLIEDSVVTTTTTIPAAKAKKKSQRAPAAVWVSGNVRLQAVELPKHAPISETVKRFRHESLYGERIRRMPVAAFLGLQKKKAAKKRA